MNPHFNVLFIDHCNSARSIMAEALLNYHSGPDVTAYSAGNRPGETLHPRTLHQLVRAGIPTSGLHTKSWDEFIRPQAPAMQCVITVWDEPEHPACPQWPGHPITANWGISDPLYVNSIAVPPGELDRAFTGAFVLLEKYVKMFLALPLQSLDLSELKAHLDRIGHS